MPRFPIDYNTLDYTVNKSRYKLSDVKDKLVKVAFDVVKFRDSDELWQIQSADDGEYIVAKYDEENKVAEAASHVASPWSIMVDASNLSVFYKGHPIAKLAASKLGLSQDDLLAATRFLPNKLGSDKNFVVALLNEIDPNTRKELIKLYPEIL